MCTRTVIFLLVWAVVLSGCSPWDSYQIIEDKPGPNLRVSDFVSLSLVEKTEEGEVLRNTSGYDQRNMLMYVTRPYFKGDISTFLAHLSEGDSASFRVDIDSLVQKMYMLRPAHTKGRYLLYTVRVNKVVTRGGLSDSLFNVAIERLKAEETERARVQESSKIERYIASEKIRSMKTVSGLRYVLERNGTGLPGKIGDTALVNFKVTDLDGALIETNIESEARAAGMYSELVSYRPFKDLITAKPISGFQESLSLLPKGAKARLIVPSRLGYGVFGARNIAPYTPLLVEIELVELISGVK